MSLLQQTLRKSDTVQQRHRWLAFPFAVIKKFGDDQAGYLAALIAYYGFFSVFPLLLVFVTVLGLILGSGSHLATTIQQSALSQFPVIGQQIKVNSLHGSGLALAIGIVGALWAGMGVTQAAQNAMNEIWDVKKKDRPNFLIGRLRSLAMLGVLGTFTLVATFLSGLANVAGTGTVIRVLFVIGSLVANLALFTVAFRVLTQLHLKWRDVVPGALFGAVIWTILQLVGTYYVQHQVAHARSTYGTFAFVIGLLIWIYPCARLDCGPVAWSSRHSLRATWMRTRAQRKQSNAVPSRKWRLPSPTMKPRRSRRWLTRRLHRDRVHGLSRRPEAWFRSSPGSVALPFRRTRWGRCSLQKAGCHCIRSEP